MVDTDLLNVYSDAVAELPKLNAEDVAQAVYYALETPNHVQVEDITLQAMRRHGADNEWLAQIINENISNKLNLYKSIHTYEYEWSCIHVIIKYSKKKYNDTILTYENMNVCNSNWFKSPQQN